MCGRYSLTTADYVSVAAALQSECDPALAAAWRPRFNVAPTDIMPVLVARPAGDGRRLVGGRWGLVAPRDRARTKPPMQINARVETVSARPLFRGAFARWRVGVVADGFYEWTGSKRARQPVRFCRADGGLLIFAGIATSWLDPNRGEMPSFAILTTSPTEVVAAVHDRMPVLLDDADLDAWLRPAPVGVTAEEWLDGLRATARSSSDIPLVATLVSPRVNDVRNDDAACLEAPARLFP